MAAVGPCGWFGLADGRIKILAPGRVREWRAHEAGVISLVPCGSRVYSLAADGSIHGWCSTSPNDSDILARYWSQTLPKLCTSLHCVNSHTNPALLR